MSKPGSDYPFPNTAWQSRYSLLRNYLLWAIPLLLLLTLIVFGVALWQARSAAANSITQEMTLIAQLWDRAPDQTGAIISGLPDSPTSRSVFAIDSNGSVIAQSGNFPNESTWETPPSARLPAWETKVGSLYTTRNQFSGDLFHWWQPQNSSSVVVFISYITAGDLFRQALKQVLVPLAGLTILFCLGGGIIEGVERKRAAEFNQLAEASIMVTEGNLGTSVDVGGNSDIGRLGTLFDHMRQVLKQRIDNSALLLQVSQDVSGTRDLDHGMNIILQGLLQATDAVGARAVVFNPSGSQPMQFGEGRMAGRMGKLDRRLLIAVRNTTGDIVLRNQERIRERLEFPADREMEVSSLIAFPLYSIERLHGIVWVGYDHEMTHEPSEIDLMRSYVTRAAAMVANMRLYALAEGGYRRLAAVLRSTQEVVIVIDQTNRVVLANPALGSAFGLDIDEIIGRNVTDVFHHPDLESIMTGPISSARGREITNDAGDTFFSSVSIVKSHDGRIVGRVAVLHDITQLKQLDEMKSEFVRNVSHDLRNPLAYMHTYASMLPEFGPLTDKQRSYVDHIVNGIQRMHDTIGAVLDLNRIESASDELIIEAIDSAELLNLLAAEHADAALSVGNEIVVAAPRKPVIIYADRWSLRLAMNNLISNALKYAPGKGEITLAVEDSVDSVILRVTDRGAGISKADQLRLFEKYYRASEPAVPQVEGSGLGLAIVKSIAQRHGGRTWVRSQQGHGSTFCLSIPKGLQHLENKHASAAVAAATKS